MDKAMEETPPAGRPPTARPRAITALGQPAGILSGASAMQRVLLGVSLAALLVGLLDFALIIGAVPIPVPGLRAPGDTTAADTATYSFEHGAGNWTVRDAASNAAVSATQAFAGHTALQFQVSGLSDATQAFIYLPQPADAKPGTRIVAHIYVPVSAPALVGTVYALDGAWQWHSGAYPGLTPGQWTAVTYQIPRQTPGPIREIGLMVVGAKGAQAYTGPLYLDSVDLEPR